jgi:hypothetical protein
MNTANEPKRTVRSLRELSRTAEPARDLWPGIAAQLPRRRSWAVPVAAAASVVLVIAAAISLQVMRTSNVPAAVAGQGALIRAALMTDPEYQQRRRELLQALPAKLAALPPESQQRVSESLAAIQAAMRDIETELGRESGNVVLQQLLISTSQEEMRVLTVISEASALPQEI